MTDSLNQEKDQQSPQTDSQVLEKIVTTAISSYSTEDRQSTSSSDTSGTEKPLLEIKDLDVDFKSSTGIVTAVRKANLTIYPGQTVAIVGESGSGKSTTAGAVIGLLPGTGKVSNGSIEFDGRDITHLSAREWVELRGSGIGMVPQDPMTNLNPVLRIGDQVKEALKANNVTPSFKPDPKISALLKEAVTVCKKMDLPIGADVENPSSSKDNIKSQKQITGLLLQVHEALKAADSGILTDKRLSKALAILMQADRLIDKELVAPAKDKGNGHAKKIANLLADASSSLASVTASQAGQDDLDSEDIAEFKQDSDPKKRLAYLINQASYYLIQVANPIATLLEEAGLSNALRRTKQFPHEFSGGMRQRVLIAIGLAAHPKLLIADEPTSALDVTVQRRILDHLDEMTKELGTAVLFITHDLGLAAERAEQLVVMHRGRVVESGPALEILQHPQHPYTKRLVNAAPSLASARIESAHARGITVIDEELIGSGAGSTAKTEIIRIENLTKDFHIRGIKGKAKTLRAVDNVSFGLRTGTTLALVGESGSGKSTVANMVLNLLQPTSGKVYFKGEDCSTLNTRQLFELSRKLQVVFQNPYGSLDPMYSVFRIIEEPLKVHNIGSSKERVERVAELLDLVALPRSAMRRYPNELSGGQRQRVAIARALALNPEVVVLDEAVSALDVLVQNQILVLLNDLQAQLGLSYLFITHDLAVVRQIADDVVVMENGKIVEMNTSDELFSNPIQPYTQELIDAVPGRKIQLNLQGQ